MRKVEIALAAIAVLAFVMLLNLWPGGYFLMIISLSLLTILYYPLGFFLFSGIRLRRIFKKDSYKEATVLRVIWALAVGSALGPICLGLIFRINNYSGGDHMLSTGLIACTIALVIVLFRFYRNKSDFFRRILQRLAIWGVLGLVFLPISNTNIQKILYRNYPAYLEAKEAMEQDPENEVLRERWRIEKQRTKMTSDELEKSLQHERAEQNEAEETN